MNKRVTLIRCCRSLNKKELLQEVNNPNSMSHRTKRKYPGLVAGVYGENVELEHLDKSKYIKPGGCFKDWKNYKRIIYLKTRFDIRTQFYLCFTKGLHSVSYKEVIWQFEVNSSDIIGYCGDNARDNEENFNCDGVVIRPGARLYNIKPIERIYANVTLESLLDILQQDKEELEKHLLNDINTLTEKGCSSYEIYNNSEIIRLDELIAETNKSIMTIDFKLSNLFSEEFEQLTTYYEPFINS